MPGIEVKKYLAFVKKVNIFLFRGLTNGIPSVILGLQSQKQFAKNEKAKNNLKKSLDKQNPIGYTGKHKRDLRKSKKTNRFLHIDKKSKREGPK